MAVPTYVGASQITGATGAITCTLPASIATDDILLLFIETANEAISIANANGGTWTEVTNSPQGTGTAGGTTATRLTTFWSRYNGSQTAPVTSDSGDHQFAVMIAVRGCETSGNPWNITSGNTDASDTSLSIDGATTTVNDCFVVTAAALADDASDLASGWTHSFTSHNQRSNWTTTAGNDGRLLITTGEYLTAGTYGATTATLDVAIVKACMTVALMPPQGAPPPGQPTMARWRGVPHMPSGTGRNGGGANWLGLRGRERERKELKKGLGVAVAWERRKSGLYTPNWRSWRY